MLTDDEKKVYMKIASRHHLVRLDDGAEGRAMWFSIAAEKMKIKMSGHYLTVPVGRIKEVLCAEEVREDTDDD